MQSIPYVLEVGKQEVILTPDPTHEFTATTEQVALGYGVSVSSIREHKRSKSEELFEGKHFLTVSNPDAGNGNLTQTLWTKRGIVRLGFFIRSARARLFRDMAEDLVIGQMQAAQGVSAGAALITARAICEATGYNKRSMSLTLMRRGLKPTHHYFEPRCGAPTYLYPLSEIQAQFPQAKLKAFEGEALEGIAPVVAVVEKSRTSKAALSAGTAQPRLLTAPRTLPTDSLSLARELVQVETRRAEILAALGGAA